MQLDKQNMVICRCEEVSLHDLTCTAKQFDCSSREIKLRTRAAMGYCGGRTCRYLVDRIIREIKKDHTTSEIPLSYRPPVRPIPFETLGRESNE
jgi:NAD(P)H-nitrite reductase large subunit